MVDQTRLLCLGLLGAWVSALAGCGRAVRADFESLRPADRLAAIVDAAERGDESAIPYCIEFLDSDDSATRVTAVAALRKLTGQAFGYEPGAPREEREAAADQWAYWYAARSVEPGAGN